MKEKDTSDYEIKLKEFGKPIFKAKGKKDKIKKEFNNFCGFKL